MNLEQLCNAIETQSITSEMYSSAKSIIKSPRAEEETYTLREYTTLLYVLGAYKEIKDQSVYCGLRIEEVCSKSLYRIDKTETTLEPHVDQFRSDTQRRVKQVLKLIERRFISINLVLTVVLCVVLMFLLKQTILITVIIGLISFALNYFVVLPKTKTKFVATQMALMREALSEDLKEFEATIY